MKTQKIIAFGKINEPDRDEKLSLGKKKKEIEEEEENKEREKSVDISK